MKMLIGEKMETIKLSNNEELVKTYIKTYPETLKALTTRELAELIYTSPSTLVRFSKKLGFTGWNEFRDAYLKEYDYLTSHFTKINANMPFTAHDTMVSIANKIISLKQETLEDTKQLINTEALKKATELIINSNSIKMFGSNNIIYELSEFQFKMSRINRDVFFTGLQGEQHHFANRCKPTDVAIIVSYTGESSYLLKIVQQLRSQNIPIIAITRVGNNRLSNLATITLHVTTREKAYGKIGAFSSLESIRCVLDILYSCVFAKDYQKNLTYKKSVAKKLETARKSSNQIIKDE